MNDGRKKKASSPGGVGNWTPPYGKSWKKDLEAMGGKDGMRDPRFKLMHKGEELSLVTRSSDGQMLFLANMASKMNAKSGFFARPLLCFRIKREQKQRPGQRQGCRLMAGDDEELHVMQQVGRRHAPARHRVLRLQHVVQG